jgi:mono/diheme cytochrome c family protein
MKNSSMVLVLAFAMSGCNKQASAPAAPVGAANAGAALVEVSGGKQATRIGAALEQPVVLQVNDAQGAAVAGAMVTLSGAKGVKFDPASGATDSSGQFTAQVWAPGAGGHFQIVALTNAGKVQAKVDQVALGYEQVLGRQLSTQYCARCHDPESTPERVSNMDNLDPKPHAFSDGETYNKIGDSDLIALIGHGGPALNKSASMPPFGYTLSVAEIQALASYIRAIADPPYTRVYANK